MAIFIAIQTVSELEEKLVEYIVTSAEVFS